MLRVDGDAGNFLDGFGNVWLLSRQITYTYSSMNSHATDDLPGVSIYGETQTMCCEQDDWVGRLFHPEGPRNRMDLILRLVNAVNLKTL